METNGHTIYGFWDGDYTFHHVEYAHSEFNHTIRVRIDNASPEARAHQNEGNHNHSPAGRTRVRPATQPEIDFWLDLFKRSYPLRAPEATEGLRHLRINGPTPSAEFPLRVAVRLLHMTFGQTVVRDFNPQHLKLVEIVDDKFQLTDEGLWLTGLMK